MVRAVLSAARGAAAAGLAALALASNAAPGTTAAESYKVEGTCREGVPHGSYELKSTSGKLRVVGAYNRGKRTSSFIFWNAAGVRVAHIPFDDDVISGTVAVWYAAPARNGVTPQKLEAVYTSGRLNGVKRSWHVNGRLRGEFTYEGGVLGEARAWDVRGDALPEGEARALAARDLAADDAYYRSLDELVRKHPPSCRAPAPTLERA